MTSQAAAELVTTLVLKLLELLPDAAKEPFLQKVEVDAAQARLRHKSQEHLDWRRNQKR